MTDTLNDQLVFVLRKKEVECLANATGSFFDVVRRRCCGLIEEVQSSDIAVDLLFPLEECLSSLIVTDVGPALVPRLVYERLIGLGVPRDSFRAVLVNGRYDTFYQIVGRSQVRLWPPPGGDGGLCDTCYRTTNSYEPEELYLLKQTEVDVSFIAGRKDFAEVILSEDIVSDLVMSCNFDMPLTSLIAYGFDMDIVMRGDESCFRQVRQSFADRETIVEAMRVRESLAAMRYFAWARDLMRAQRINAHVMQIGTFEEKKQSLAIMRQVQ